MTKLNLGCGSKCLSGYVNVDHPRTVTPKDVDHDLEKLPWPFDDNSADEILMQDSLEHLTFPDEKVNEVHRILKPGGVFWGGVPYAHSDGAVQCFEHRWLFTEKSFAREHVAKCETKEFLRLSTFIEDSGLSG